MGLLGVALAGAHAEGVVHERMGAEGRVEVVVGGRAAEARRGPAPDPLEGVEDLADLGGVPALGQALPGEAIHVCLCLGAGVGLQDPGLVADLGAQHEGLEGGGVADQRPVGGELRDRPDPRAGDLAAHSPDQHAHTVALVVEVVDVLDLRQAREPVGDRDEGGDHRGQVVEHRRLERLVQRVLEAQVVSDLAADDHVHVVRRPDRAGGRMHARPDA